MTETDVFLPRIPQPVKPVKADPPFELNDKKPKTEKSETLFSWIAGSFKAGIKALPKMAKTLGIQLGVVLLVNLIFWQIIAWKLPGALAAIVSAIIFLTATYNNVIPKTIYWVIVFTFGKKLFFKVKREGVMNAISPIKETVPEFKKSLLALKKKAYSLLLFGGGAGLVIANNFASYSRFSGARNKMDKYFIALVISFAVSYALGESKKGGMFKLFRLANNDLRRLLKKPPLDIDDHTFILLSGFVAGLLLDAPLILMKAMYGGYILGAVLIAGGVILQLVKPAVKSNDSHS